MTLLYLVIQKKTQWDHFSFDLQHCHSNSQIPSTLPESVPVISAGCNPSFSRYCAALCRLVFERLCSGGETHLMSVRINSLTSKLG